MIYFDAHCDTILRLLQTEENLLENSFQVDLKRLSGLGKAVQVFALCVSPACCEIDAVRRAFALIDRYNREILKYPEWVLPCNRYSDVQDALRRGKVAALLSIEGGEALAGGVEALRIYERLGVRSLCLTHNARNELGDGVAFSETGGGLTPFGKEVVREMNRLDMLVDVSHLSEAGFWDVLETTSQPVIASHSNAKALCANQRNLTDQQLRAIRDNGGVVGINYYPAFLTDDGKATQEDILAHIRYMASLIGCDHIGLGSDFDGIPTWPADVADVTAVEGIINALARHFSPKETEQIAGGNFMRLMRGQS